MNCCEDNFPSKRRLLVPGQPVLSDESRLVFDVLWSCHLPVSIVRVEREKELRAT